MRHGAHRLARLGAACALLACALFFAAAPGAFADDASEGAEGSATEQSAADTDSGEVITLSTTLHRLVGSTSEDADGAQVERLGAVFPGLLSVSTTPSAITTGIACSGEMCDIDPCTCGKPDAWGHCACSGTETTVPTVVITTSDADVARAVYAFGQVWIVPVSSGSAVIDVSAELVHYGQTSCSFTVEVQPFGALDVALIVAAGVALALVLALVLLLARLAVRGVRALARRASRRAARVKELKEEYPMSWRIKLAEEKRASAARRPSARTRRARGRRGACRPFLHDFALALRRALPVLLGALAVFAVLVPLSTSVVEDCSVFNVDYTHEQLKYQLFMQDLAPFVNAACVVYGAVLAVVLFSFLLQKRSTTAFLSVGLSRVKLFAARYLAGAVCVVVGVGLPFAVSGALNVAALGLYDGFVHEALYVTCGYALVALVSFSLAAIAASRAGTLFESCAFCAALLLGVTVVLWGVGVLAGDLLVGNAAGATLYNSDTLVADSFLDALSWLNPVLFFAEEGASHQYFSILHPVYYPEFSSPALLLGWFAAFLAFTAAGLVAFCRRPGEQAEMAGRAPVLSVCSVAVYGLAAFSGAVAVAASLSTGIALAAGSALFVLVSLLLLFGPLRGRTPRRVSAWCVAGELAAMGCVVAVLYTGAFGFSGYVPDADDVESVEVSYVGSPSYLTEGFSGVSSDNSYYYTSQRTYTDASSIEIVQAVHAQLAATARSAWATDYADFSSSVVPYDVVIRYTLSSGREIVRYYSQATVGELSSLLSLDNDEHTRLLESAVITGETDGLTDEEKEDLSSSPSYNAYRTGSIYVADGALNRVLSVEVDDEARAELLAAIASDVSTLTAAERYFPEEEALAVVMFTLSPEVDVSSFGYSFSNAVSYVTESWTATVAWLEEYGYLESLGGGELDPLIIESLTLQLDDPYASINEVTSPVSRYFMGYRTEIASSFWITQDYGSLVEITDQATIAELMGELRLGCYMDGGYLVEAKLRGIDAYVYFYLPAEAAEGYV